MLTMGIEVSASPPFLRKNTNKLLSGLSPRLREELTNIRGRQTVSLSGNTHRFWIQTGKLTVAGSQGSDRIISRYGRLEMKVLTHLLRIDKHGREVDDEISDKDELITELTEALTEHYDEIGMKFPEFARLRELAKIAVMYDQLAVILERSTNIMSEIFEATFAEIRGRLSEYRFHSSEYPTATESRVKSCFCDVCRRRGVNPYEVGNAYEIKRFILQQLKEQDKGIVGTVSRQLSSQCPASESIIRSDVDGFLRGDQSSFRRLCETLTHSVAQRRCEPFHRICDSILRTGLKVNRACMEREMLNAL
jgi:hypothetical protein